MFSTLFYYKHKSRATSWVPAGAPFSCLIYGPVVQVGVPVFFCAPLVCQVVCGPSSRLPGLEPGLQFIGICNGYASNVRAVWRLKRTAVARSGAAIAKKTPSRVKQISRWDLTLRDRDLREDSHAKYEASENNSWWLQSLVFFLYKKGRTQNRSPKKGLFRITPRSARERCRSWDFIAPRGSLCCSSRVSKVNFMTIRGFADL